MSDLVRVMHVEDDQSIQDVARVALEIVGGFQVCTCSSGQEALHKFSEFSPHLVRLHDEAPALRQLVGALGAQLV